MNLIVQASTIFLSVTVLEESDVPSFSSIVVLLSQLSDIIQNLLWLAGSIIVLLIFIAAFLSIRRKTTMYTRTQINRFIKNGKYIQLPLRQKSLG